MLNTVLSSLMREGISSIMEDPSSHLVNIKAIFTNPNKTEFTVVMSKYISNLIIEQDFIQNYGDKISLMCRLSVPEYLTLYEWRKDLRCELQFTNINMIDGTIKAGSVKKYQYLVFFVTQHDPFRSSSSRALMGNIKTGKEEEVKTIGDVDSQRMETVLELIPADLYKIRKVSTHFIARNVTMADILSFSAKELGMVKQSIEAPDNTKVYEQFIVPPSLGIADLFPYLQYGSGNGVYNKGFAYYYTQETLYVYPRFGDAKLTNRIDLYSVGENMYPGLLSNHIKDEDGIKILINTPVNSINYNDVGVENDCTAIIMQQTDTLWDDTHIMTSDAGVLSINSTNLKTIYAPGSAGASPDNVHYKYSQTNANEYALTSVLVRLRGTEINFTWNMAVPWTFEPHRVVYFNYECNDVMKTDKCVCEKVVYTFQQTDSKLIPIFTCSAEVRLTTEING